jgi:starch-binding outer membrane protein, SusD/RagB family
MKNIFLFVLCLVLLTGLDGCNNKLDVKPRADVELIQPETADDVEYIVRGAYAQMMQTGDLFGSNYNMISELLAANGRSEFSFSGSFGGYRNLFAKEQAVDNNFAAQLWIRSYQVIAITNTVEQSIGLVAEDNRNRTLGEAKFIRAITYFELIRLFAKTYDPATAAADLGVPLVSKVSVTYEDIEFPGRATVAQVYQQIIADLTEAKNLLPQTATNGRATTWAASAYLSRVYLQTGNNTDAGLEATRVIESGEFGLTGLITAAFNNSANTREDVFAIQQNAQNNAGTGNSGLTTFYASLQGIGRGDMDIRDGHLALYEEGDDRGDFFYEGSGEKAGRMRTGKWRQFYTVIPLVRLAEMYLTRAEANLRAGTVQGASPIEDINVIRNRAGLAPATQVTLETVFKERKLELAWEGDILHSIKRFKKPVGNRPYTDPKLILPIPQRELDANVLLRSQQNEGY